MATSTPITGHSSIGDWLGHPVGGPFLRALLAQGGQDESVFAPVRNLPLEQLVNISQGRISQAIIDDLVARANGGVISDASDGQPTGWQEVIVPGRFTGQTVIVTGAASGIGERLVPFPYPGPVRGGATE